MLADQFLVRYVSFTIAIHVINFDKKIHCRSKYHVEQKKLVAPSNRNFGRTLGLIWIIENINIKRVQISLAKKQLVYVSVIHINILQHVVFVCKAYVSRCRI